MSKVEKAAHLFKQGFSCSQAVLAACGEGLGVEEEKLLKISSGFGAGMGRMGEVCGAVTGAFMAIGLKHGRGKLEDQAAKEKTQQLVSEFAKRFKARHRTVICRDLLGCDLSTAAGIKIALEKNLFTTLCPKFVSSAAEILGEIME